MRASSEIPQLLMVRRAGAPFAGDFNIRVPWLKSLLDEYISIGADIRFLSQELVNELHALVPQTSEHKVRNLLLKLKRNVFNCRAIATHEFETLLPLLSEKLKRYSDLLQRRKDILESNRQNVMQHLRQQLNALVSDEKFRAAVDYSCPWLVDAYKRHAMSQGFSDEDRGVYSYAVKFFSKANPFYSFASVALPASAVAVSGPFCEVLVDTGVVLALEKALVPRVHDPYQRLVSLCSFERDGNSFRFWITHNESESVQVIKARATPVLECIVDYFSLPGHEHCVGGLIDQLSRVVPSIDQEKAKQSVSIAIQQEIVREYLIKDLDNFAECLSGVSREHDQAVQVLSRLHLACVPVNSLSAIHKEIQSLNIPGLVPASDLPKNLYYVNTYDQGDWPLHEELAKHLYEDLQRIKPFFGASNFTDHSYVISAFIRDQIKAHPAKRVRYLELVRLFLRDMNEIIATYIPSNYQPESEKQAYKKWRVELARATGQLSAEELASLYAAMPESEANPRTLCFNGTFDYAKRVFYLSNIFAGDGRFGARFLLSQNSRRYQTAQKDHAPLDVQLVLPLKDNRNYVAAMFPAGCGFDSRYRHKFERWIDPAQVVVELQDGQIVYRDCGSDGFLHFHFCGFLLAEYLPPEYKLFLTGHADCYPNPFESFSNTGPARVDFVPGLQYGSICLRRAKWVAARSLLDPLLQQDDLLTRVHMLREFIHENLCANVDQWYFRTIMPGAKPRYLDPNNPLSVDVFCRDVAQANVGSPVIFSRMEPEPEALFPDNKDRFMTELMVEV